MFASKLKKLRENKNLTYRELANDLNKKYDVKFSKSTIQRWEENDSSPSIKHASALAHYFDVTLDELTKDDSSYVKETAEVYDFDKLSVVQIPVLAKVSAGLPIYAEENIISQTVVSKTLIKNGKEYFGLIVSGDSMDKEFKDGDIVIVEKDAVIENGQIAVVQVNGYNATVKRVRYKNDVIILLPESTNNEHQPQFYTADDEVTFVGKVVGMNRKY